MGKVYRTIPFLRRFTSKQSHDFGTAFRRQEAEILNGVRDVIHMDSLGDQLRLTRHFEKRFAKSLNARFAIGVASGTDALYFALKSIGVGPGQNVITVANTWMTTISSVYELGASCTFVDIDPNTGLLDTSLLEAAITSDIRAILPVHMYGNMVDMEKVMEIANRHKIAVIEDACQAVGASLRGRAAGTWGNMGCFSFHATKLVGGPGDGGMITTNDKGLRDKARQQVLPNWDAPIEQIQSRIPSRLSTIMVPFLSARLAQLEDTISVRKRQFQHYQSSLADIPSLRLLTPRQQVNCSYRNCILVTPLAKKILIALQRRQLPVDLVYSQSAHRMEQLVNMGWHLPVSAEIGGNHIALPLGSHITDQDISSIVSIIRNIVAA